jgi:hypothetical protein
MALGILSANVMGSRQGRDVNDHKRLLFDESLPDRASAHVGGYSSRVYVVCALRPKDRSTQRWASKMKRDGGRSLGGRTCGSAVCAVVALINASQACGRSMFRQLHFIAFTYSGPSFAFFRIPSHLTRYCRPDGHSPSARAIEHDAQANGAAVPPRSSVTDVHRAAGRPSAKRAAGAS